MAGRPPIYSTPDELEAAILDYFEPETTITEPTKSGDDVVIATGREPRKNVTITGLAYHLGFESRQSFYDYEEKPEFSYIIKKARLRVEMSYEERLSQQSPTGAIFALKNMGWRDKSEVENSGNMAITWKEEKSYEAEPKTD